MIGSAAARHLAEAGQTVALIGASEALDYESSTIPFASHYDQGRITRISDSTSLWAELAGRSTTRYADIADRSRVSFHTPRALAHLSTEPELLLEHAAASGGQARLVDREWLRAETGISFRDDEPGDVVFEGPPAGHVNPRRLIAAQVALAVLSGAETIDAPATAITSTPSGFTIATNHGEVDAKQVLLATGAYSAGLVGVDLAIERRLRTIVLAELGDGTEIPSLIMDKVHHAELDGIYWVPPVLFPDGRVMLKIGGTGIPTLTANGDTDIADWFRSGGSTDEAAALKATVRSLLPGANITSWDHKPCVITATTTERPFLGYVADGVAVAVGGNGGAAKSCDEIGRLAASLLVPSGWAGDGLAQSLFEPEHRT